MSALLVDAFGSLWPHTFPRVPPPPKQVGENGTLHGRARPEEIKKNVWGKGAEGRAGGVTYLATVRQGLGNFLPGFPVVVAHGVLQQRVLLGGPLARGRLSPRRRRRHAQPRRVHGRVEPGRRLRGQQEWRELWPRRRGGGVWLPRPSANSGQWARARPNATTRRRVSSWFRSGRGLAPKRLTKNCSLSFD